MGFFYVEPSVTGTALSPFTFTVPAASATPCYSAEKKHGVDKDQDLRPCGTIESGVVSCCKPGSICMDNNFCMSPDDSAPQAHFYLAGCTDASYEDPLCSRACQGMEVKNVVWHEDNQTWQCCGKVKNTINCTAPLGGSFVAPGPLQLNRQVILQSAPARAKSSTPAATETGPVAFHPGEETTAMLNVTVTATATASVRATTSPVQPDSTNIVSTARMDTVVGVTVGVTVGVIVLITLIVGGILFFLRRLRKRRKAIAEAETGSRAGITLSGVYDNMGALLASLTIQEKDEILMKIYEAHADARPVELDAFNPDSRKSSGWMVSRSSTATAEGTASSSYSAAASAIGAAADDSGGSGDTLDGTHRSSLGTDQNTTRIP